MAANVLRKDSERKAKKLLGGTPRGGRKKGRPGLRRRDEVKLDLRDMAVKRWRTRALARTEWHLS
jgi:hypothetical protein